MSSLLIDLIALNLPVKSSSFVPVGSLRKRHIVVTMCLFAFISLISTNMGKLQFGIFL